MTGASYSGVFYNRANWQEDESEPVPGDFQNSALLPIFLYSSEFKKLLMQH
jgi:hypothetical protein